MQKTSPTISLVDLAVEEACRRIRRDQQGVPEGARELLEGLKQQLRDHEPDVSRLKLDVMPTVETLRLVRNHFGVTLKAYTNDRLLEIAERLVSEPALPLRDIAASLGFTDAEAFCRWYKRWTDETPKQVRAGLESADSEPFARSEDDWPSMSLWFRVRIGALDSGEAARLIRRLSRFDPSCVVDGKIEGPHPHVRQ